MRILSQNGLIDVPYEMSSIYIVDEMVLVSMVGRAVEGRVIARYSTPAKAEKAMEMLRDAYLSRMELDGGYVWCMVVIFSLIIGYCRKYFNSHRMKMWRCSG